MRTKIVIAVTFCGTLLYWSASLAQNQPPNPETVRLISSIQGIPPSTRLIAPCAMAATAKALDQWRNRSRSGLPT
jgi:hypothetical protein